MDYCGETIGIRVSDDRKQCCVIVNYSSGWKTLDSVYDISQLPYTDTYSRPLSVLDFACEMLGLQNPAAREQLQEWARTIETPASAASATICGQLTT